MTQSLEQFQAAFGCEPVQVELDEQFAKDGAFSTVLLKPLTSAERDEFEASVVGVEGKRNLHNLRARLVCNCWVNGDGKPIGTAKQIGELRADFIGHLFDKVRELNGMDDDVAEQVGKD